MAAVDIVIPLYNKAATVARAIHSIRAQTFTDWRLIVVDDGSTDDGPAIVTDIDDPRIQLVTQPNAGPGAARNKGIQNATARYIAFLDADDEWYPHYLHNAISAIQTQNVPLVASMYCLWPGRQDMTASWAKRSVNPARYSLTGTADPVFGDYLMSFPHVWNSVMYTDIARRYDGFYDKDHCLLGEDTVFFMRIIINEPFAITGELDVCHHTEDSDLAQLADRPIAPFLIDPSIVLDYCPADKKQLMAAVIDHMALRHAVDRLRRGFKDHAASLIARFPGATAFTREYSRYNHLRRISCLLPHWVRLKCTFGPPVRKLIRMFARAIGLLPKLPASR